MLRIFSRLSSGLKYTRTHEWLQITSPGLARLGISKFAQDQLGEVVYCDFPAAGAKFDKKAVLCTLESVKAVGEVYCPIQGAIVKSVNEALKSSPSDLNEDPEGKGWLVELQFDSKSFNEKELLDETAYAKIAADAKH